MHFCNSIFNIEYCRLKLHDALSSWWLAPCFRFLVDQFDDLIRHIMNKYNNSMHRVIQLPYVFLKTVSLIK